ncbi:MAG: low molecular weight phosphotyrosine protein phosphatase [Meiothermus sp.]|uniref:low molecular weight protein-tyrosine-phosphatase n=1 Tax=Meiothermus sp. TaxID=1955249 RepID=UPI0025E2806E|nr:low molecular weight protein-tyrosine-phosphatase [Meiothermus sp.]MCS7058750.1 low molecular weight phosphotyrosine protein phosphatase [Meiothermus sp.]MCS7195369.1 low molecular weight phosphotyrosine protein phosphatase [Meiothermus sp.]MCX7740128.1 low molecular weight phosphotyrosine protein phosphatase [Meiothermus sp.]MDW8091030.1 low molecular weight protein-tyrosine-phosphatase [Meiothermus sp.]MDW8482225.1 low molecular weight protein-tyrosine-phosphatase [Meiothermus sp.]
MTRVLFVCMGNICRSPMAEGILRRKLKERGLEGQFEVDSCGTGGWHEGEPADPRTEWVLAKHNALFPHTARRVRAEDLSYFDHVFVMDYDNLHTLERMFPEHKGKARLILELNGGGEVPDPYYGGLEGFERVYQMLDEAIEAFLNAHAPR